MNDLKWNGKEIISFLNIFQNYPCLWDVQSNNYLNRNVTEESCQKLLEDLRIAEIPGTPESIKNKIKILRETYRKKLNEVQKSNNDANDEVHKPKLIWFSAAEVFCHSSDTDRESSSNLDSQQCSTSESEEDTSIDTEVSDSEHSTAESQNEKLESQSLVESLQSASTTQSTPTRKRPPLKMSPPQPEKFLKQQPQHLPSRFEKTVNKLQQTTEQSTEDTEDQYDTFSKHLASQLEVLFFFKVKYRT